MKICKECGTLIGTFCPTCDIIPPIRTAYDLWEYELHPNQAIAQFEAETNSF